MKRKGHFYSVCDCLIVATILWLFSFSAHAENERKNSGFFGTEDHRIGLTYLSYGGERTKSLTGGAGYGLEAALFRGNSFIGFVAKVALETSSGNVPFSDNGTTLNLDYSLFSATSALGIRINPLLTSSGVTIYLGATALFGIAQLTLPNRSYALLKTKETTSTTGSEFFGGVELGSAQATRFFLEAGLRSSYAKLAGNSKFQIEGLVLRGGIAW